MNISPERKQRIFDYLSETGEKPSIPEFRRSIRVSSDVFREARNEYNEKMFEHLYEPEDGPEDEPVTVKVKAVSKNGKKPIIPRDSEKMKQDTIRMLYQKVMEKGDHNVAFRLAQIMGWIVEKKEEKLTLELSADDRAKRLIRARDELRDGDPRRGMVEVSGEPPLLHGKLCLDSGQGKTEDSPVGTVASPDGDN